MSKVKGASFSAFEKEILIELVSRRKEIIECKENNSKTLKKKEQSWKSLTSEYNSRLGVTKRTEKQLKNAWKNLKAITKKAYATERREKSKTGGSPDLIAESQLEIDLHRVYSKVLGVVSSQISSLENTVDDDATFHGDKNNISIDAVKEEEKEEDYIEYASGACESPKNVLVTPSPEDETLMATPVNNTKTSDDLLRDTYTLKIQFMKEEHEHVLRLLKQEEERSRVLFDLKQQILVKTLNQISTPGNTTPIDIIENVDNIDKVGPPKL